MKALALTFILIFTQQASAQNSCFSNDAIAKIIRGADKIEECLEKGEKKCFFYSMDIEDQKET